MSVVTFDLTPTKDEAPAAPLVEAEKERCREEVFRIALAHYIAEYQKHHAAKLNGADRRVGLTEWFRRLTCA